MCRRGNESDGDYIYLSSELSVTFRYRDHIGCNNWKIISRLITLRFMLGLTPTWATRFKIGVE